MLIFLSVVSDTFNALSKTVFIILSLWYLQKQRFKIPPLYIKV